MTDQSVTSVTSDFPSAILLDLGNVVLEIDFTRVFHSWADGCDRDAADLARLWSTDEYYNQHETGEIPFHQYAQALARQFDVDLTSQQWLDGWNALFVGAYPQVCNLLPEIARHTPLYAFTNTNPTHQAVWTELYRQELEVFENIYVSSEMGLRKPAVESFFFVCEQMKTTPASVLFIDDSLENVAGARAAGLTAQHVASEKDVVAILSKYANPG